MKNKGRKRVIIYMATCTVNGKRYIGVTTTSLRTRANGHFSEARRNRFNGHFHRAIRKHGKEAFEFAVIEVVGHTTHALRREAELIAELKPEYNSTLGGEGRVGGGFTPDGLRRISEFQKGKSWRLGMTHSAETRKRLSEWAIENDGHWAKYAHLGPKASSKKVVCLNTGTIYESASSAARENSLSKSLVIEVCLRNPRRKTAGGLVFRYFGDHLGGKKEAKLMLKARDEGRAWRRTRPMVPAILEMTI